MSLAEEVKSAPAMTREQMGEACLQWQTFLIKLAFKSIVQPMAHIVDNYCMGTTHD